MIEEYDYVILYCMTIEWWDLEWFTGAMFTKADRLPKPDSGPTPDEELAKRKLLKDSQSPGNKKGERVRNEPIKLFSGTASSPTFLLLHRKALPFGLVVTARLPTWSLATIPSRYAAWIDLLTQICAVLCSGRWGERSLEKELSVLDQPIVANNWIKLPIKRWYRVIQYKSKLCWKGWSLNGPRAVD